MNNLNITPASDLTPNLFASLSQIWFRWLNRQQALREETQPISLIEKIPQAL